MYGGTLTSVLVSMPGESSTVMTSLDGYQMARKGRAGAALGIAAIGSFIAGTIGALALMLLAPPLARGRAVTSARRNTSRSCCWASRRCRSSAAGWLRA